MCSHMLIAYPYNQMFMTTIIHHFTVCFSCILWLVNTPFLFLHWHQHNKIGQTHSQSSSHRSYWFPVWSIGWVNNISQTIFSPAQTEHWRDHSIHFFWHILQHERKHKRCHCKSFCSSVAQNHSATQLFLATMLCPYLNSLSSVIYIKRWTFIYITNTPNK